MIDTSSLRSQYMTSTGNSVSSSSSNSTSASSSSATGAMGKNDFLTLLTTQLKYQDPLNPQDSSQFASQLAQFTSLEQLTNINSNIEGLSSTLESGQTNTEYVQALAILGKNVSSSGNTLAVNSGTASGGSFTLSAASKSTSVGIYNSSGTLIRTLSLGALSSGANALSWDGKDSSGTKVADGSYSFKVSAMNSSGSAIKVTTGVTGTATGVEKSSGKVKIKIGDTSVSMSDITSVS
jgi:flagellar basal-body rod modification protein FlgD